MTNTRTGRELPNADAILEACSDNHSTVTATTTLRRYDSKLLFTVPASSQLHNDVRTVLKGDVSDRVLTVTPIITDDAVAFAGVITRDVFDTLAPVQRQINSYTGGQIEFGVPSPVCDLAGITDPAILPRNNKLTLQLTTPTHSNRSENNDEVGSDSDVLPVVLETDPAPVSRHAVKSHEIATATVTPVRREDTIESFVLRFPQAVMREARDTVGIEPGRHARFELTRTTNPDSNTQSTHRPSVQVTINDAEDRFPEHAVTRSLTQSTTTSNARSQPIHRVSVTIPKPVADVLGVTQHPRTTGDSKQESEYRDEQHDENNTIAADRTVAISLTDTEDALILGRVDT